MATSRDYQREVISSAECWLCVLYRLSSVELRSGSAEVSAAQEVGSAAILGVFGSAEFLDATRSRRSLTSSSLTRTVCPLESVTSAASSILRSTRVKSGLISTRDSAKVTLGRTRTNHSESRCWRVGRRDESRSKCGRFLTPPMLDQDFASCGRATHALESRRKTYPLQQPHKAHDLMKHQQSLSRRDVIRTLGLATAGCLGANPSIRGAQTATSRVDSSDAAESSRPLPEDPVAASHELFERYERRFAKARLQLPHRNPAQAADREAILRAAKECLGIRDQSIPAIKAETVGNVGFDGGRIERLRATSWPGTAASALLYLPASSKAERLPLVVLCCGHGRGGKLSSTYQRMARHLTRRGAMVLCPDNIGQGERQPMGHRKCVAPFACGLSIQGLIVMETLGWIAWARNETRVDPKRVAAIGQSGGGTLTVFLAALCPSLVALSSSGYPCTFDFIARKEKTHCHCNLLPGIVGRLEMWHLLGSFAPRPMFILQGAADPLFPEDLFYHTARKVRHVYQTLGAEQAFLSHVFSGGHSWEVPRYQAVGDFLVGPLGLSEPTDGEDFDETLLTEAGRCWDNWPADAVDTDTLAQQLSGQQMEGQPSLADVFPPHQSPPSLANVTPRGPTSQVFAQYEVFLGSQPRRD